MYTLYNTQHTSLWPPPLRKMETGTAAVLPQTSFVLVFLLWAKSRKFHFRTRIKLILLVTENRLNINIYYALYNEQKILYYSRIDVDCYSLACNFYQFVLLSSSDEFIWAKHWDMNNEHEGKITIPKLFPIIKLLGVYTSIDVSVRIEEIYVHGYET